jgi:hypothetical protein
LAAIVIPLPIDARLGGHTHTVFVDPPGAGREPLALDTGFLARRRRDNSVDGSRDHIRRHYDLGKNSSACLSTRAT